MWNKPFEQLRRRMTRVYAVIFGMLILVIVAAAYTLIWWEILAHEKQVLLAQIYHEGEEWIELGEPPCSESSIRSNSMLAYFIENDGQTVIMNQLGNGAVGDALWQRRNEWPQKMNTAKMIRMHAADGKRLRYLAAVAPIVDNHEQIGILYMFKNMEFYYEAASKTLFLLLCMSSVMFMAACYGGYYLAGRNILPISKMYERQKQFTADASHEMRTPLAVVKLALEGLQADSESHYSEFSKESLAIMQSEADRLQRLTENLMTLARCDEGETPVYKQPINITALCCEVRSQMQLLAAKRQIKLLIDVQQGLSFWGDEMELLRLLIILLDNAMKYSPDGSSIFLRAMSAKEKLFIEVADEGCGISDEDKKKVFYRFYRVDKARSRSQGGLGLGLSLALAIAAKYKGTIKIFDNKPKGTIFSVKLPKQLN